MKRLVICERKTHLPEHDGATGYFYYEPVAPYTRPQPDTVAISRGDLEKVMVALHDATAGYRYIEANHPTLYGVGYHRCIHNGKEALSILEAALKGE